jgi:hypothetical protein
MTTKFTSPTTHTSLWRCITLSLPVLRLVLGALVSIPAGAPTPPLELYKNAYELEVHWNIFVRDLWGCQRDGETTAETCHPSEGVVNYKEYMAARKAAKKLFELREIE